MFVRKDFIGINLFIWRYNTSISFWNKGKRRYFILEMVRQVRAKGGEVCSSKRNAEKWHLCCVNEMFALISERYRKNIWQLMSFSQTYFSVLWIKIRKEFFFDQLMMFFFSRKKKPNWDWCLSRIVNLG